MINKTTNSPKLSIIVAMYNAEPFLDRFFMCLDRQIFKDFEVIIVDDVSTDNSLKIASDYANKNSNVKLIASKEKLFPDLARQKAFNICEGEYVIYLDSDDMFSDDYLSSMFGLIDSYKLDIVFSSYKRIDENDNASSRKISFAKKDLIFTPENKKLLIKQRYSGALRMVRRQFLIDNNYDYLAAEIPLFILQFYSGAKVGFSSRGCYFYRKNRKSISRSGVASRMASYNVLEPLDWIDDRIDLKSKDALSVYLVRMMIPNALYKKVGNKQYDYKKDITTIKKTTGYTFKKACIYFKYLLLRDKIIMPFFMFNLYFPAFVFIKWRRK